MPSEISGKILFANAVAVPGVMVRIYDEDAPGKGDDDLTITPGLSDATGSFTVAYDPGKYLDFVNLPFLGLSRPSAKDSAPAAGPRIPDPLDVLSPYLQFSYIFDAQPCTFTTRVVPFQSHYYLPESQPVHFLPSQDSFKFGNLFPGVQMPFTIPFLPNMKKITGDYGLCGGMSAAASDLYLAGRPVPALTRAPNTGTVLYRYLFRRAMDSFAMGESILRFARWMALPDDSPQGVFRQTQPELDKLRVALDQQRLQPIGLVISAGSSLAEISQGVWSNHQVLAYRYAANPDGSTDVYVYDPNSPCSDTAYLHTTQVQVGDGPDGPLYGVQCQPVGINITPLRVRGFFMMPYEPADPPDGV